MKWENATFKDITIRYERQLVSRKFDNFTEDIKHFLNPNEASKPHETESQNIQTKEMKCISCEKTFRYSMKLQSYMILIHRTFKV